MDAKATLGEPRVLISRAALLHNVRVVRRALRAETKICAVLKADAYGHGAKIVADALTNFSSDEIEGPAVDAIAVATTDEAAALHPPANNSTPLPILIFRPVENVYLGRQRQALELAIRSGWVLTVCSPSAADDLGRLATTLGKRALIQVMVDTGMTGSGVCGDQCAELLSRIEALPSLRLVGLCTHFARADEPESAFTRVQFLRFQRVTEAYAAAHPGRFSRHAANSGGIFAHRHTHLDMVRPGLCLYGVDPFGEPSVERSLRPAMKWTAPLVHIRTIRQGVSVGYGQSWKAPRDSRIGLVPVGYADGYPRHFAEKAVTMLHGRTAPVVGRVSMDQTTIDLTDFPAAQVGDEVTLLDNDPLSPASVYNLSKWSDTIPYEVFCRIGSRIKRVAVDPGDDERQSPGKGRVERGKSE